MPLVASLKARAKVMRNLFRFFGRRDRIWMLPIFVILLAFFGIIILGHSTPLGPFIYAIF